MAQRVEEHTTAASWPQGFWWWFLQRFSGVLLLLLVGVHLWAVHMAQLPAVLDGGQEKAVLFAVVQRRMAQALFVFVNYAMLALALYHGLNGLRAVLLEWAPARRRQRGVTRALALLGLAAFGYGAWALTAFM